MASYAYVRPYSPAPVGGPVVVATIGTSVLRGGEFTNPGYYYGNGGWRPTAFAAMTTAGMQPDFIGDILCSADGVSNAGTSHGGHGGSTSAQWISSIFASWQAALTKTPHVICIETGPNDADDATDGAKVCQIADMAAAAYPRAALLVATRAHPLVAGQPNAGATHAAKVRTDVAARKQAGMHITLVEQFDAYGDQYWRFIGDDPHPNRRGYLMLGELWGRHLVALASGSAGA